MEIYDFYQYKKTMFEDHLLQIITWFENYFPKENLIFAWI